MLLRRIAFYSFRCWTICKLCVWVSVIESKWNIQNALLLTSSGQCPYFNVLAISFDFSWNYSYFCLLRAFNSLRCWFIIPWFFLFLLFVRYTPSISPLIRPVIRNWSYYTHSISLWFCPASAINSIYTYIFDICVTLFCGLLFLFLVFVFFSRYCVCLKCVHGCVFNFFRHRHRHHLRCPCRRRCCLRCRASFCSLQTIIAAIFAVFAIVFIAILQHLLSVAPPSSHSAMCAQIVSDLSVTQYWLTDQRETVRDGAHTRTLLATSQQ